MKKFQPAVSDFNSSEIICDYNHSNVNRVLEKMIPLLRYFSEVEVKWSSYEERLERQRYFPSKIPEELKNVTLIVWIRHLYLFNIVEAI
jgi:hypothetical protein